MLKLTSVRSLLFISHGIFSVIPFLLFTFNINSYVQDIYILEIVMDILFFCSFILGVFYPYISVLVTLFYMIYSVRSIVQGKQIRVHLVMALLTVVFQVMIFFTAKAAYDLVAAF